MTGWVVDTNVAIVANGPKAGEPRPPSPRCRKATINFLSTLRKSRDRKVFLDQAGRIEEEYRRYLNPRGQPGVGDRFYMEIIRSAPKKIERVDLPQRADGEYVDLPQPLIDKGFDPSDRKFAALARRQNVPVVNATDSDWLNHGKTLAAEGIVVEQVCGGVIEEWFD